MYKFKKFVLKRIQVSNQFHLKEWSLEHKLTQIQKRVENFKDKAVPSTTPLLS